MSKEDAPNFRSLKPSETCGTCKNGNREQVRSYIEYIMEPDLLNIVKCMKYNFAICQNKEYFVCDSWEGE